MITSTYQEQFIQAQALINIENYFFRNFDKLDLFLHFKFENFQKLKKVLSTHFFINFRTLFTR